jgi:hypothetical protein
MKRKLYLLLLLMAPLYSACNGLGHHSQNRAIPVRITDVQTDSLRQEMITLVKASVRTGAYDGQNAGDAERSAKVIVN